MSETTLTDFLLARIAEDEAWAHKWSAHEGNPTRKRVLAECEAKRRIVELHRTVGYEDDDMNDIGPGCYNCGFAEDPCETLCLLALPYADHPDYREEWKP